VCDHRVELSEMTYAGMSDST